MQRSILARATQVMMRVACMERRRTSRALADAASRSHILAAEITKWSRAKQRQERLRPSRSSAQIFALVLSTYQDTSVGAEDATDDAHSASDTGDDDDNICLSAGRRGAVARSTQSKPHGVQWPCCGVTERPGSAVNGRAKHLCLRQSQTTSCLSWDSCDGEREREDLPPSQAHDV